METELYEMARTTSEYIPQNGQFYAAAASSVAVTASMYVEKIGFDSEDDEALLED